MDAIVAPVRRPLPPPRVPGADLVAPNAAIIEREDISASIARLVIRPDAGAPGFRPGQYFSVGIDDGGRPLQRPYSTASADASSGTLEFLIRLVEHGELTPRLWPLQTGDRVRLGRPKGRFVPDADDTRRALYVATGTGIAPLRSMLESLLPVTDAGDPLQRPIVVQGVARPADLAYRARFEELDRAGRIHYLPAVSRRHEADAAGWTGAVGRLDGLLPGILAEVGAQPADLVAYICGSPGMTEAVTSALGAFGMPDEAIRSEAYWTTASGASES